MKVRRNDSLRISGAASGFTLIEALMAIFIMSFGLLAAGQMIFIAAGSGSLARSKDTAAVAAQNRLESLTHLYNLNPASADLTDGTHGPNFVNIVNGSTQGTVNRFSVSWTVSTVADPRPGKVLKAKQISVTVTPVTAANVRNYRANLNKVVTLTAVLSMRLT